MVTIPQIDEQKVIETIILCQDQTIEELLLTLEKAMALKTALMQDLLMGKKRVTDLLNDTEAASV